MNSPACSAADPTSRSEEHTSELQSQSNLVCRLLLEKKTHLMRRCGRLAFVDRCVAHVLLGVLGDRAVGLAVTQSLARLAECPCVVIAYLDDRALVD